MIFHPDPRYEEAMHTETGGLWLIVQYPGPNTGKPAIYDGRFNMERRKPLAEERFDLRGTGQGAKGKDRSSDTSFCARLGRARARAGRTTNETDILGRMPREHKPAGVFGRISSPNAICADA